MITGSYWWSRYGDFPPGDYNQPHHGAVIACYRKRRGWTQQDLAIAAGVEWRTVREWEAIAMLNDTARRIFLAKLLRIPPALLGLDWRLLGYQDAHGTPTAQEPLSELAAEDAYYHYEDILALAWQARRQGTLANYLYRLNRCLSRLELAVEQAPAHDREAWQALLCRYYRLAAEIERDQGASDPAARQRVLHYYDTALRLAEELEDPQLAGATLMSLTEAQLEYGNLVEAKRAAEGALQYSERVQPVLRGNIYLVSAAAHAPFAVEDETLRSQCRRWQEQATTLAYRRPPEDDGSFLKLNLAGVHHERAKTLLTFGQQQGDRLLLQQAREELALAWQALTPDLVLWQLYFSLTEARLHLAANELEASAHSAKEALGLARFMQSRQGREQVQQLYERLLERDSNHPHVLHLGVELGLFS
ncbi:hypothetical protein KTAU_28150 [Thermogemmatispora aurantia]|jgi:transcriptional regulator with XRE-family HTH domain|uniref:hypothetical protein n=2 Tax=Thermogemmatispora TaxID=768669 RepID=UPI00124DB3E8|nr:hypothetical protein [Thermogemmatispora aurantia]GER84179.1 hypothetical protein KTAU_28150 [Thermogemmatispora aurantia]